MDSISFRDFLFLYLFGFLMLVVIMLPLINPPSAEDEITPPGNIVVTISWPEGNNDVDWWGDGPGELRPVGYSNKSGVLWDLLRDDLGNFNDATPLNFETAVTRGVVAGEYIINVHCYRCPVLPVPVDVEVRVKTGDVKGKAPVRAIATTRVVLAQNHQELTALRFVLDKDGKVEPNSLNHVYRPLRSAGL